MENCIYKTPCGWCSKWEKPCDSKMYTSKIRKKVEEKITCFNCASYGWGEPQCRECKENNFKYFSEK